MDRLMDGALLLPKAPETKADVAGQEARRVKKLMGALRHLYRS